MNANRILKKVNRLTKDFKIAMTTTVGRGHIHKDYLGITESYERELARLMSVYKVVQLTRLHRDLLKD